MTRYFRHIGRSIGIIIAIGLLAGFQASQTGVVWAHGNVARSEPAPDSVLQAPPRRVAIWFTEPLEPQFGAIQVLDGAGERVDNGDSAIDRQDPTLMVVSLPPLPDGTYTVVWTNVSSVDGHKVRGSFLFSVGEPLAAVALAETPGTGLLQSPLEPVLRWATLLSIMAVVGGLGFQMLIWEPVLRREREDKNSQTLRAALASRWRRLTWAGLGLFLAALVAHLLLQTTVTYELSLARALGRPLTSLVLKTGWGRLWSWRAGLSLAVAVVLWLGGRQPETRSGPYKLAALLAGLAALLTLSLTSHAAAAGALRGAAVFNDYVHLLAASFWVGGLFHFALGLPLLVHGLEGERRRALLAALVPRFSALGLSSVAVLALSGLYGSWVQVTVLPALATAYGRTLLAKLGLVGLMLLLAALNLLWVRRRLAREDRATNWLRRLVAAEALLALLVLLLVGGLTALEPARQVASREGLGQAQGLSFEDTVEGARIALEIEPGRVGVNRALVTLKDPRGQPIGDASDVSLRAAYLARDLGASAVSATTSGEGRYAVEGLQLSVAGSWQLELVVRRPDAFGARSAFRFEVEAATGGSSAAIAPAPDTGRLLWGLELTLLGLTFAGVVLRAAGWRTRRGVAAAAPGALAALAGMVLAVNAQLAGPAPQGEPAPERQEQAAVNPILPDATSLAAGQRVYEQHCMICHGLTGHGDGPRSAGTDAVDIIEHVPLHADAEYFEIVDDHAARGDLLYSPGPISDDEIWHLVNYLHAFETDQLLAERYFRQGLDQDDVEQALASFDTALELSPRFALAYKNRGIAHLARGDLERAIADESQAIALDPGDPEAYTYRAMAYNESRQPQQAIDDFTRALGLDPGQSGAFYGRGLAYANAGDVAQAVADLSRYLELAPQAGDRDDVEGLIARLQGAAAPAVSGVTLALADLPAGFEAIPPAELGLVAGSAVDLGFTIEGSFAFGARERFELVWGFTTRLASERERADFDARLQLEELVAFLSGGIRADDVLEPRELQGLGELGEARLGLSAVFVSGETRTRLEGVALRSGNRGVLVFVTYRAGEVPSVQVGDLARVLQGRSAAVP